MSLPRWHHPLRRGAFLRHDAALHFLARPKQYPLSDSECTDLIQVVEGFTSPHTITRPERADTSSYRGACIIDAPRLARLFGRPRLWATGRGGATWSGQMSRHLTKNTKRAGHLRQETEGTAG
jgi:hypothetical protein